MEFGIRQTGNWVEVRGGDVEISFGISGIDLPELRDMSFAVWLLAPQAMVNGSPIHIKGVVDPLVIRNVERLSQIWEMWMPGAYREVSVSAEEIRVPSRLARGRDLDFFSGGIDSTFYLLQRGRRSRGGFALTIHGTDYKYDDHERFSALLKRTSPLLDLLNYERIVMRTNAIGCLPKGLLMHGFLFTGCAFLLSGLFDQAVIAPDNTWEQDMLRFPWGTNHVTNRYFAGTDFKLANSTSEWGRTAKAEAISNNAMACDTLSFCVNYAMRPDNCGKCVKCVRTKINFLASTGACPQIFVDNSINGSDLQCIDTTDVREYAFIANAFFCARDRGTLDKIPGFHELMSDFRARLSSSPSPG